MRLWKDNLLLQFSIVSFVTMALLAVLLSLVLANSIRDHVVDEVSAEARDTLYLRVLGRLTPQDLDQPLTGARLEAFHRFVVESVVSQRTARIKLWSRQGQLLYADDFSQIGKSFPISHELAEALQGQVAREVSVPKEAENERERLMGTLIEVYVPVVFPGTTEVRGAFEIYQYYAPVAGFISSQRRTVLVATFGAFGLLYVALFFIVGRGWRTIRAAQQRVERSLREVTALNNLFRGYLAQRQRLIEEITKLHTQVGPSPQNAEALRHYCDDVWAGLSRIAEEASRFPSFHDASGLSEGKTSPG